MAATDAAIAAIIVLALILCCGIWALVNRCLLPHNFPPSPIGVPLFRNLLLLKKPDQGRVIRDYAKKYQRKNKACVMGMMMGDTPTVWCCDKKSVKDSKHANFLGRPDHDTVKNTWLDDKSTMLYGDPPLWTKVRKFSVRALKEHRKIVGWDEILETETDALVKKWQKVCDNSRPIRPFDYFRHVVLNTISQIFLAHRFSGNEDTRKAIDELKAMDDIMRKGVPGDFVPSLRCLGTPSRLIEARDAWRAVVQPIFDRHFEGCDEHLDNPRSAVDIMYKLRQEEDDFKDFSDHDLFLFSIVEFNHGSESPTIRTLDWMIVYLIQNKKWQHRLHAHVREVCGDEPPRCKDIAKLPLIKAFVLEQLRYLPTSIFSVPKKCLKDGRIGGYPVAKDMLVAQNLWAVHHDRENYPHPDVFDPERFLDTKVDKEIWIPFGYGKRQCPGTKLAMKLFEIVLANWMYYFRFDTSDGESLEVGAAGLPMEAIYDRIRVLPAQNIYGDVAVYINENYESVDGEVVGV